MPGGTKLEEKYLQMKKKKYDAIYALYAFFHKILTEVEKKNNNALYMPRGRLSIY